MFCSHSFLNVFYLQMQSWSIHGQSWYCTDCTMWLTMWCDWEAMKHVNPIMNHPRLGSITGHICPYFGWYKMIKMTPKWLNLWNELWNPHAISDFIPIIFSFYPHYIPITDLLYIPSISHEIPPSIAYDSLVYHTKIPIEFQTCNIHATKKL